MKNAIQGQRKGPYKPRVMPTDLDELQWLAKKWGADDAVAIKTSEVLTDPRVRFKCMVPKCYMSGGCGHCPPNGYTLEDVRKMLDAHDWAVFFRVKVPAPIIAAKGLGKFIADGNMDPAGNLFNLGGHYLLTFSIVKLLQKTLSEMGYVSRAGFAAGNCRDALCHFQPNCMDLATGSCRHADLSSPSMESCGMDAFTMAARQGWEVYPIGGTCEPESVGGGNLMGLVLIASENKPGLLESPTTLQHPLPPKAKTADNNLGERLKQRRKEARRSLDAMKQSQVTPALLLAMARERKIWTRFTKNLHELYGSWGKVLAKNHLMFSGQPRNKAQGC